MGFENENDLNKDKSKAISNNSEADVGNASLQSEVLSPPPFDITANTTVQRKASSSGGLGQGVKTKMENSFGEDFSNVKIHTNSEDADGLNAKAFTQGSDIHFGKNQYQPNSKGGQELIGHELTHVVQQKQTKISPSFQAKGFNINNDSKLEQEADTKGALAAKGKYVGQNRQTTSAFSNGFNVGRGVQMKANSGSNYSNNPIQLHPGHSNGGGSGASPTPNNSTPVNTPQNTPPTTTNDTSASPTGVSANISQQIDAFKSRIYGPQNVSTSIGGRFNASFYPHSERLFIDLSMGVDFLDVLNIDASQQVTINATGDAQTDQQYNQARQVAMALPAAQRAAFVANYQWNAAAKTSKLADLTARNNEAESIWSNKHQFFIDKPGWEEVVSNVSVSINEHETSTANDQLQNRIYKTPSNLNIGAWVNMAGNANQQGLMTLDDDEVAAPTGGGLLEWNVQFPNGSSRLNATSKAFLDQFITTFADDGMANKADGNNANDSVDNGVMNKVKLIGRASSGGPDWLNKRLAEKRSKAVFDYLQSKGFHGISSQRVEVKSEGSDGAAEDASWRRVDLIVGDGQAQNVVAHELGHVFGLDDEYATNAGSLISGTGNPTGTQIGHDGMATGLGANNATAENNDGIMSLGNNVRAQHYATFGNALQQVTNTPEWRIKS